MKRVLIISPHFPPVNAADMHRIRQSLPYFRQLGWEAEVITVFPEYIEAYSTDPLLLQTIPSETPVHYVKAWDVVKSRKFGLGSLSMRSFFYFLKKGNSILKHGKFDLIYFSTTAFHVMALGPYWKKKFSIPFVLDIQDPWRNDFYLSKPKKERPNKFFIAYNIDKFLEARTIPYANGIISVSDAYCATFKKRYNLKSVPFEVIPFGGAMIDFNVMEKYVQASGKIQLDSSRINIVYIGRGGYDMTYSVKHFFEALKMEIEAGAPGFKDICCWFIGTSYATEGKGKKTIEPIAVELGLGGYVREIPDRIPYFETLFLMKNADVLFVPGSTDEGYTASKIYPYILASKPLLAVFHEKSSIINILNETSAGEVVSFSNQSTEYFQLVEKIRASLTRLVRERNETHHYNQSAFVKYSALSMTQRQVEFFNQVLIAHKKTSF